MLQLAHPKVAQPKPGPFVFKSAGHRLLVNVAARPPEGGSSLPNQDHLKLEERKVGPEPRLERLSAAGLCWSSAHLVQCGPDEPS